MVASSWGPPGVFNRHKSLIDLTQGPQETFRSWGPSILSEDISNGPMCEQLYQAPDDLSKIPQKDCGSKSWSLLCYALNNISAHSSVIPANLGEVPLNFILWQSPYPRLQEDVSENHLKEVSKIIIHTSLKGSIKYRNFTSPNTHEIYI